MGASSTSRKKVTASTGNLAENMIDKQFENQQQSQRGQTEIDMENPDFNMMS